MHRLIKAVPSLFDDEQGLPPLAVHSSEDWFRAYAAIRAYDKWSGRKRVPRVMRPRVNAAVSPLFFTAADIAAFEKDKSTRGQLDYHCTLAEDLGLAVTQKEDDLVQELLKPAKTSEPPVLDETLLDGNAIILTGPTHHENVVSSVASKPDEHPRKEGQTGHDNEVDSEEEPTVSPESEAECEVDVVARRNGPLREPMPSNHSDGTCKDQYHDGLQNHSHGEHDTLTSPGTRVEGSTVIKELETPCRPISIIAQQTVPKQADNNGTSEQDVPLSLNAAGKEDAVRTFDARDDNKQSSGRATKKRSYSEAELDKAGASGEEA